MLAKARQTALQAAMDPYEEVFEGERMAFL